MSLIVVPSKELIQMQAIAAINLQFVTVFDVSLKVALMRDTFHPDEFVTGPVWAPSLTRTRFQQIKPTVPNKHSYEAIVAGVNGGIEPTFPTDGGTVVDGAVTWQDIGIAVSPGDVGVCSGDHRLKHSMPGSVITEWTDTTVYAAGSFVFPTPAFNGLPRDRYMFTIAGGTSGGSEPAWVANDCGTTVDNTVSWITVNEVADVGENPFISELEIFDDIATVGYPLGGLTLGSQLYNAIGRNFTLRGDQTTFAGPTTISAAWCAIYVDDIIGPDANSEFWYYPPIAYGLLTDDRSNLDSINADFVLAWDDAAILRVR